MVAELQALIMRIKSHPPSRHGILVGEREKKTKERVINQLGTKMEVKVIVL